jgi:hypothetical protein
VKEKLDDLELKFAQRALEFQNFVSDKQLDDRNTKKYREVVHVIEQELKKVTGPVHDDKLYIEIKQLAKECHLEIIEGVKDIINVVNEEKDKKLKN